MKKFLFVPALFLLGLIFVQRADATVLQNISNGCNSTSINSAIGCIPILNSGEDLLSFILKWAIGVGGGIAFILIIYAGFMIMSSSGNQDRLKAGQELLTSAITGIIMLIFSIFILKVVGVDILGLGSFGFGQ